MFVVQFDNGGQLVNVLIRREEMILFVMKILINFIKHTRFLFIKDFLLEHFIFLRVQIFSYNLFSIFQSIDLYVPCTILLRLCISSRSH